MVVPPYDTWCDVNNKKNERGDGALASDRQTGGPTAVVK